MACDIAHNGLSFLVPTFLVGIMNNFIHILSMTKTVTGPRFQVFQILFGYHASYVKPALPLQLIRVSFDSASMPFSRLEAAYAEVNLLPANTIRI